MHLCPVLVGRQDELAALRDALREAGVVLVVGEAGIGKSRLLREFAEEAHGGRHSVLWGRPELVSEPGPYSLILDLLDSIADRVAEARQEAIELGEALAAPKQGRSEPPARQIAARTRGLIASAGRRPVVIIEDLHAADEPSQAVIAHLARSARDDGTLLVGALRSEEPSTQGTSRLLEVLTRDRLATTIELPRLTSAELAGMLEAMWGERPPEDEFAGIEELAEGIPFFVEELAAVRGGEARVPESIARSVRARLQGLDDLTRRVIQVASLVRGAIDPLIVAEVTGVSEPEIASALVAGVRAGLLIDEGGRLAFRHSLLRQVASDSIVSIERRELHRALAAAIEKHRKHEIDRYATALASHYLGAGETEAAAEYEVLAGGRALDLAAYEDAKGAFERAIAQRPSSRLYFRATIGLADALLRQLRPREAAALLEKLRADELSLEHMIEVLIRLGNAYQILQDRRGLEAFNDALEQLSRAQGKETHARVRLGRGRWLLSAREYRQARDDLLAAVGLAEEVADAQLLAEASATLPRTLVSLGDPRGAESWSQRARSIALANGFDDIVAESFAGEAVLVAVLGEGRRALELVDEGKKHLTKGFSSYLSVQLDQVRVWILQRMGLPEDAARVASRLETSGVAHSQERVALVWAAIERHQLEWATEFVKSWWEDVGVDTRQYSPEELWTLREESSGGAYALLAESILHAFGDAVPTDEARDLVERNDAFSRVGIPETAAYAALLTARVAARRGELDRAARALDEAEDFVSRAGPVQRAHALEVRGALLAAKSSRAEAARVLEEARDAFASVDNSSDRARTMRILAGVVDKAKAKEVLKDAREIASSVGALMELARIEAAMREIGMRPRAGRPKGSGRKKGELTGREEEIVALVAAGVTNAEIATRLFLSGRTIEDHLRNAQRSLGVTGRAGLAAWAAKNGLI